MLKCILKKTYCNVLQKNAKANIKPYIIIIIIIIYFPFWEEI